METYYALGKLLVAVAFLAQCLLLAILILALKRHRQLCFGMLALGAAFGLIYAVVAGIQFFVRLDLPEHLLIAKITVALLACGAALSVWGMALLVRSYSILAERAS